MTGQAAKELPSAIKEYGTRKSKFASFCIEMLGTLLTDARVEFAEFADEIIDSASKVKTLQTESELENSADVARSINALVIKMQFADRFCQRLENAQRSLGVFKTRLDQNRLDQDVEDIDETDWHSLLAETRALFTTEQERMQFDEYFGSEAESIAAANRNQIADDDLIFFD